MVLLSDLGLVLRALVLELLAILLLLSELVCAFGELALQLVFVQLVAALLPGLLFARLGHLLLQALHLLYMLTNEGIFGP